MQADFTQTTGGQITTLGRKAWTAYVALILGTLVLLLLLVPLAWSFSKGLGTAVFLIIALGATYKFMALRAVHLYSNEMGVWLYTGILPWTRGVRGVKWRDLDDATYTRSMGSWLLKSYSLRIGHRFTRSSEMLLSGIAHGDKAVMTINQQLQDMARAGKLS